MLHLHFALFLLVSKIGIEIEVPEHYRTGLVCKDISTEIKNRDVACEIERAMMKEGFEQQMIKAALLNAYAESEFNPRASGDKGKSKGVFQLHKNGLGHKMTDEERYDVKLSVKRISIAIRKSLVLKRAIENGAKSDKLTELFCTEIMRPKNKYVRAGQRKKLESKLFKVSVPKRRQI